MLAPQDIAQLLRQTEVLKSLTDDQVAKLAPRFETASMRPAETVVSSGDPAERWFVVAKGSLTMGILDHYRASFFRFEELKATETFGEEAVLTGSNHVFTVSAASSAVVLSAPAQVLSAIVTKAPLCGLAAAQLLAWRVQRLARANWVAAVNLQEQPVSPELLQLFPLSSVMHHLFVPLRLMHRQLTVGCVASLSQDAIAEARAYTRCERVEVVRIEDAEFQRFLDVHAAKFKGFADADRKRWGQSGEVRFPTFEDTAADERHTGTEIVELVNTLLVDGLREGASDIHIEPTDKALTVRYRIDGRLVPREPELQRTMARAVVARLKVLSNMDIAEKRLPQDARIQIVADNRRVDLRVSTIPVKNGEKMVMRILDAARALVAIDRVISSPQISGLVRRLIQQPHGVVIIAGPTGSGKTTTLYSILRERATGDVNITTVEDPIEYNVAGINQVQVNPDIGLTFPVLIRALLRQDPDVIMVGETRDRDTAKMALEAGLTGHLVLTSLHTNDSLGAVARLKDMDQDPFAIASALSGVVSQRLVRQICQSCTIEAEYSQDIIESLGRCGCALPKPTTLFRGKGCPACSGMGYRGRIGAYELLVVGDELRAAIGLDKHPHELRQIAARGVFMPLSDYVTQLLTKGKTTPFEALRILAERTA